jgi:signal peptidase I
MDAQATRQGWRSSSLVEAVKTVASALLIAVVIRTFLFQPFNIPSSSMENTLLVGDYLFVSKFAYGYSKHSFPWSPPLFDGRVWSAPPQRGDVAVFKLTSDPSQDFIKRVIGLPGDRIQMIDSVLYINGEPCKQERIGDYVAVDEYGQEHQIPRYRETLPGGVTHEILDMDLDKPGADNTQEFVVPEGHYFMMGDNRDNSNDSRMADSGVGFVPEENLVGRADIIFFSTDGSAQIWEIWKWPTAIRYSRFFHTIG